MKLSETKTNFLAGKVTAYLAIEFGLHKQNTQNLPSSTS